MNKAKSIKSSETPKTTDWFYQPVWSELTKVVVTSALAGLLVNYISMLFAERFFVPAMCSESNFSSCTSATAIAFVLAAVLISGMAAILFVRWRVFRPIMIIVASFIAFYGLPAVFYNTLQTSKTEYYAMAAILYGLSYGLFYFTARFKNVYLSFAIIASLVIAIRLSFTV